jgi:CheY-like chemotaxis protein
MSDAREIVKLLPSLRRYARALAGTQSSGDSWVRLFLEAFLADRSLIGDRNSLRAELYRGFHAAAAALPAGIDGGEGQSIADRLASLSPRERQILLLTTIEGFAIDEAAYIAGEDAAEAARLLERARGEMRRQRPTGVLIIEDESVIALNLRDIVEALGHTVVGTAATADAAITLARETHPGLILADIRLQDGSSGLDAVRRILAETSVPVVFITAFPEYLLTGERPEPTFLVTKPFDALTVTVTISQALLTQPEGPTTTRQRVAHG